MRWISFLLIFILALGTAQAVILGASPGNVAFNKVLRDGYAERYVTVSVTGAAQDVLISVEPWGETASWFNYSNNFTITNGRNGRMFVSVNPPSDIPNGNYTGYLRISTSALGEIEGGENSAAAAVIGVIDLVIRTEIVDNEILDCSAFGFDVQSVEEGDDIIFNLQVSNNGNIRLRPTFTINIWDQEQISVVQREDFTIDTILPTKTETRTFRVKSSELDIDQYWAEVNVPECYSTSTLTFDVLETGAIKSDGVLIKIVSDQFAEVDDTLPIYAIFQNTGEKEVDAKFKGQITREGKIIQLLESEETRVGKSEIINFTQYFTPLDKGKYIVSGRVFYDKKRTFEQSASIEVFVKSVGWKEIFMGLAYIILLALIALLFIKIRNEKRRYLEKMRYLRG